MTRDDTPMQLVAPRAVAGKPLTVVAINPPAMSASWWYLGRIGDQSKPLGIGKEMTITPTAPGTMYVWVWAVSPIASTSVELAIEVEPAPTRRRSARH